MKRKYIAGFTLIELLIVIGIISILFAVSVPKYSQYTKRAKFLEVVLAVAPYKLAAEIAVQVEGASLHNLTAGKFGIPKNIVNSATKYLQTIDMVNGKITAIAKNIDSKDQQLAPLTYKLEATIAQDRIIWVVSDSSSCLERNLCNK